MKKKVIIGLILISVAYVMFNVYTVVKYMHHFDNETYKNYSFLLKDSVKKRMNPYFSGSYVGGLDIYNSINYKDFNITIWEFKDLNLTKLENTSINTNIKLNDVKIGSGEVINKKANPEISIKYGFTFKNRIKINLDESSKIIEKIDSINYKGFYGIINKMSFSDEKGEHLILFNYPQGKLPTLFLLYKTSESFYVIMIESDKQFDESIIHILNLK